ncbi:KIR protein [Plasmodium coatneyi]|uniref:KIR protein n=1 Tax=Plasmodium coatneyi TaxID=208452 RepID=A0A1B1DSN0_9APIC|nr:KIR protein [Plasmodium coatneyi]ANQ05798.1 KIR protein [Plasmodium coatneyi]
MDDLPSQQIYAELKGAKDSRGDVSVNDGIENLLSAQLGGMDKAKSVLAAWSYASKKKEERDEELYKKYCNFFYYWLDDMIPTITGTTPFYSVMELVYTQLQASGIEDGCPTINTSSHITKDLFKQRKLVFDYYEDYQTMYDELPNDKKWCTSKYQSYLQAVLSVYNDVLASCASDQTDDNSGDPCCVKVNQEPKETKYKDLLEKGYTAAALSTSEDMGAEDSTNTPTTAITPIVSTMVPILGVPFAAFMLYKLQEQIILHQNMMYSLQEQKEHGEHQIVDYNNSIHHEEGGKIIKM